ncbi:hypothetical protein ACFFLM_08895 [Deinococcus oregonensis]|uniref:Uncharacterized protein n=1 Tax=Deinococcus oregonensis TaxID=1805970 RepID=A0ABV6B0U9_9DEIO
MFLLSTAAAADIDCKTLILDSNGYLGYQTVEVFPNPVQKTAIRLNRQTQPLRREVCGFTVTADRAGYSFKAKNIKALVQQLGTGSSWPFRVVGMQLVGGRLDYPDAAQLDLSLPDGLMHTDIRFTGYFNGLYLPKDALMAVRVNGGPLKPLLYNGTFRSISFDPKITTLELFIKSSKPVLWEKMLLDVGNSRMSFIKKAAMPSK